MRRLCLVLMIGCLLAAVPDVAGAKRNDCKLDGVWYGFNTYGHDFVMTITKSEGGHYTAVVINPETDGQGEFVFKRRGEYETSWMTYFDNGDGTWTAVYMRGDVEMTGCDSWKALMDWELYVFTPGIGQDPFDGFQLPTLEGIELHYRRLP